MNVFIKIKNFFRRHAGQFEVWDTSAISTWFDKFKEKINKQEFNILVPEGVSHELSMGRHNHEKCRIAYDFIQNAKKEGKLKVIVTKDKMRSWAIDEQVVATAYDYFKKGYNVSLITCDRDQANRATYRGMDVKCLNGTRIRKIPNAVNKHRFVETNVKTDINSDGKIKVECLRKGKLLYINVNRGIAVYDSKGKRKIGRDNLIPVINSDVFVLRNCSYMIESAVDNYIILKKVDGT